MTTTSAPPKRRLVPAVVILLCIALIAVLAAMLLRSDSNGIDGALSQGRPAPTPAFDLEVLNRGKLRPELTSLRSAFADGRISNRELLGTPVVLNIWASWCKPCQEEAPDLKAVSEGPDGSEVLFLGLNALDASSAALDFAREHELEYPNIRETDNDTTRKFGAAAFPETFFIDARGRIVGHVIGAINTAQLRDGIAAARSGKPQRASRGGAQQ